MIEFQVDADDENADWTKRSWDFPKEVNTAAKMRSYIDTELSMTVEHFKTLTVYKLNVEKMPWLKDL